MYIVANDTSKLDVVQFLDYHTWVCSILRA